VTNEQSVVEARQRIAQLKEDFMAAVERLHSIGNGSAPEEFEAAALRCHRKGLKYFNYAEEFVGNSGLLGAHEDNFWVTGFAEDCATILGSLPLFYGLVRKAFSQVSHASLDLLEPPTHAFANLQRMVVRHLEKAHAEELRDQLVAANLPVHGFDNPIMQKESKVPTWQLVVGVVVGVALIFLLLAAAYLVPSPTVFQIFVLRAVLAAAVAAFAGILPGFLHVGWLSKRSYLRAGGALAVFIVIWLVNPPALISESKQVTAPESPRAN
jgi:hypothetical protein